MTVFGVTWGLLGQVIWVSLVAGLAVCALFSLIILTSARASEARRDGRSGAAAALAVLATGAFLLFAAGVVIGVQVMLTR
jgi:hypothetical protein